MKPYVLSYSKVIFIQDTVLKFDMERQVGILSDPSSGSYLSEKRMDNDARLSNGTTITESIENNDEDHFLAQTTLVTNVVEPSDPDEFYFGSTLITRTVEEDDHDELRFLGSPFELSSRQVTEPLFTRKLYGSESTLITKCVEPADDECSFH